jgi:hypothetical protein
MTLLLNSGENMNFSPFQGHANTMAHYPSIGSYQGDFAYYQAPAPSSQACYDWVYVGVYNQRAGGKTVQTLWVKFGPLGVLQSTTTDTINVAITPDSLWIGSSWCNSSQMYMQYLRVYAMDTKPTTTRIEAIAQRTTPDSTAWGDWPLIAGGAKDVSGRGHTITLTGSWYSGMAGPVLGSTAVTGDVHRTAAIVPAQKALANYKLQLCGNGSVGSGSVFTIAGKLIAPGVERYHGMAVVPVKTNQ